MSTQSRNRGRLLLALLIMFLLSGSRRPPEPPPPNGENGDTNGGPVEPRPEDVVSEVRLRANTSRDTYGLIAEVFGLGNPAVVESPDRVGRGHGFQHIQQLSGAGPQGQDCFRFFAHPGDRDGAPGNGSRTRIEIKGQAGVSPNTMMLRQGNILRLHWYFRVGASYRGADAHHMWHQMHSAATQRPVIKLELRENDRLTYRFEEDGTSGNERDLLPRLDFRPYRGEWLQVEEVMQGLTSGLLEFGLWRMNGQRLLHYRNTSIDLLSDPIRPKWGIYRNRFPVSGSYTSEDTVDFADYTIQQLRGLPSIQS